MRNRILSQLGITSGALNLIAIGVVALCVFIFVKYNAKLLAILGKISLGVSKAVNALMGRHVKKFEKKFKRTAFLNKQSLRFKIYGFFDNIIDDLNMQKDGVTVSGLIGFVLLVSAIVAFGLTILLELGSLFFIAWVVVFVLFTIIFKLNSVTKAEKKEMLIMDAIDILVSDIDGGVFNAVVRYKDNFAPEVRTYFVNFVDNIQAKGYPFKEAMMMLNEDLGYTFSNFAHKAIMYETNGDAEMKDIFSDIIDMNRQKRILREYANKKFRELKLGFIISTMIIVGFIVYSIAFEPFIKNFLLENNAGKIMCLLDIVLFAGVLGYLTSIKVKSLR